MMQIIYVFLTILVLAYILVSKRRIDFLMIYFLSSVIYYLPLTLGILIDGQYSAYESYYVHYSEIDISINTYIFGILNNVIVWFWLVINDHQKIKDNTQIVVGDLSHLSNKEKQYINVLSILECILIFASLFLGRNYLFAQGLDKVSYIYSLGVFESLINTIVRYLGMYLVIYVFYRKCSLNHRIIAIIYILYSLFLGRRSDVVIIVIGVVVYRIYKLFMNKKYILFLQL